VKKSYQFPQLPESSVTDEKHYRSRREVIKKTIGTFAGLWSSRVAFASNPVTEKACSAEGIKPNLLDLKPNTWKQITRYNNYYEFTTNKEVVIHLAKDFPVDPWTVTVEGEVETPKTFDIDDLRKNFQQSDRIYPLRCVEGWSMVIPWTGFSLCELLKQVKPTSDAKYVQFVSVFNDEDMIGQRRDTFPWPYTEALRIDEAMHPLTLVALGMFDKDITPQNGAPVRIIVPWKYGFKSPKAITHIRLLKEKPKTSWNSIAGFEYGFFGNVNPNVEHPRWSQRRENRIGELRKRRTKMFNGFEEQVAQLYSGMDLKKFY